MAPQIMEAPYVLLSTPKPFGGQDSRSFAASVYRYTPGQVRQRNETAVAIDGEGVYIYDINTPRLITSYAVSPQVQFLCKPCSLVRKKTDGLTERLTYVATRQKDNKQVSIICFVEDLGRQSANARGTAAVVKQEHVFADRDTSIHKIIVGPRKSSTDEAFDVLVVHDKSIIQSFSGDLQTVRWTYDWPKPELANLATRFDFATLASAHDLRSGFLSNVHEATAAVSSWATDETTPNILVLIHGRQRPSHRRRWIVSLLRVPQSADQRILVHDVQYFATPKQANIDADTPVEFQIQSNSGFIFAQIAQTLLQWSLKEVKPTAQVTENAVVSVLPLGYAELLICRENKCSILDLEWQTTQEEITANTKAESSPKTGSKRARDAGLTSFAGSQFIDYFTGAGIAVALRSGSLIAVPVISGKPNKRLRTAPRTLAETVGKVATQGARGDGSKQLPESFVTTVKTLVQENRVAQLEEFLAKDLDLSYEKIVPEIEVYKNKRIFVGERSAEDSVEVVLWALPKEVSTLIRKTDWEKATFVLNEIFQHGKGPRFYSPSIFEWLALVGLFSSSTNSISSATSRTSALEVAKHLAEADQSLSLLCEFLSWSFHLDLDTVVSALDAVIDSLDNPSQQSGLTIDNETAASEDSSVETESKAAMQDLALAIVSLDEGMTIRGFLLRSVFDRLSMFEDGAIAKALRRHLAPRKLVFLINLLRIELADGGWTRRYVDVSVEDEDDVSAETAEHSIMVIVKLLNTAVDAIGPQGWNVSLKADTQLNTDEMLLVLRAEIAAALEGSQEFEALGAALLDFSKYCSEALPVIKQTQKRKEVDPIRNPGFVRDERLDVSLPLGAKSDQLELTRPGKAGKALQKSRGAIGNELSMRVGKYSLDRIRV